MTNTEPATLSFEQYIAAPPERVWQALTTPELIRQWWAPGNVAAEVGHEFHLDMPGWGAAPCTVLEVDPRRRFVYTFNDWTLTWRLEPEGRGTRLFLDHSGFDLDDHRGRFAFDRMGPGWRDTVLPRLAELVAEGDRQGA